MQQYDFQVAANATFQIAAAGRYIKYLSGNNGGGDTSLAVTPVGQGASKIVIVPGQAFRVSDEGQTPSGWVLANNAGGATISGKVVIGDGRIDDPTINGTVQVVDGSKARTLLGQAMIGVGAGAQGAGLYTKVALWNQANSGKRCVLEGIGANSGGASIIVQFSFITAALGTVLEQGQNKLAGGANAVAQLQTENVAAAGSNSLFNLALPSSGTFVEKLNEPIILPPGYGLMGIGTTQNAAFAITYEWYEEPNI